MTRAGVLREGHRHLDGRVSAVCVRRAAGVRRRQLCLPATQGVLPSEEEEGEGAAATEGELNV